MRSKIVFFDSNPIGQIITRFSKDVAVLDLVLPFIAVMTSFGVFRIISVAITIIILNPIFLLLILISLCLVFKFLNVASRAMIET